MSGGVGIRCGKCGHQGSWSAFAVNRSESELKRIAYERGKAHAEQVERTPRWKCPNCSCEWVIDAHAGETRVVVVREGRRAA